MKTLSVLMLALLVSAPAFAQRHSTAPVHSTSDYSTGSRENSVTGYLGFGRGAFNLGGDFEAAINAETGFGGYFLLATQSKDAGRSQVISFGADAKVHYRPGNFDFYAAPGFGIAMIDVPNDKQYTTLGPSMRLGVLYSVTPKIAVGLEEQTLYNWFSKDVVESFSMANAAVRFNF